MHQTYSVPSLNIAQCGNLAIFLPLWFYVKSILGDFRRSKSPSLTILEAWKCQIFPTSQDSDLLKLSKWPFFGLQYYQNWFHVKLSGNTILKFPHTCTLSKKLREIVRNRFGKNYVKSLGLVLMKITRNWRVLDEYHEKSKDNQFDILPWIVARLFLFKSLIFFTLSPLFVGKS